MRGAGNRQAGKYISEQAAGWGSEAAKPTSLAAGLREKTHFEAKFYPFAGEVVGWGIRCLMGFLYRCCPAKFLPFLPCWITNQKEWGLILFNEEKSNLMSVIRTVYNERILDQIDPLTRLACLNKLSNRFSPYSVFVSFEDNAARD